MRALTYVALSAALALSLPMAGTMAAGCDPAGRSGNSESCQSARTNRAL